ncbi:DNA helicase/exodeoxyribonuclease V, subunit A [Clostridium cavendishii DSM 21758]|uniref:ATP-dependent helicase/nuclease subunit A n=1 Tax=Clostridium cavendishii DSM 21758 TaxID=1121302 RepID=A0A1M6SS15_9CLOT|nr:helicase-exonuclease AddAB subunit AddA [Clostridium cavendishii]SHK47522.1 DNA helicase/exodeoxyribonuclease V, subunit A [Clostridium cavendishii DSM 21758]
MATRWTNEQLAAIETRGCNLLVAAAAGSGKTAVLVERIIRIITDENNPVDIDRLLVVTFTSAAASEMRERIGDAISKNLEKNPNSKVLQRQLALINRSNITTMHSFCLDVIKNNFHLIDLDPNFRIGDATECTLLKADILDDLFEDEYNKSEKMFLRLIEAFGGSKDDNKIKDLILDLYNFSMSGPFPEEWLIEKAEELNINTVEDLEKTKWTEVLKQSIEIEIYSFAKNLEIALDICENTGGLEPYCENFRDDLNQIENIKIALAGSLNDIYNSVGSFNPSKLKTVKKKEVEDLEAQEKVKAIRDEVKKKIKALNGDVFSTSLEEAVHGTLYMYPQIKYLVGLVIEFKARYESKKKEKGILDFNDLEHNCLKILIDRDEENHIIPSKVAMTFKEKFEEVLVDEYQDSNNVQETIVNMVSRKLDDRPNVFMVGDVKQSIYRFRQAKPELFLDKYNRYSQNDGDINRKIMLYKNFRSRSEVIEGVNYIFKTVMSKTVGELEYDEREELNLGADFKKVDSDNVFITSDEEGKKIQTAGDVELHILDKNGEEEAKELDGDEVNDANEEEELDAIQLEARIVAKRIKELTSRDSDSVYMVWDKGLEKYRRVKFKDIVILLRATKNWSEIFTEELGLKGIPVYADTGTGYFETTEIRTIMSILHIVDNPMQDIHILATLRSPIFDFSVENLSDLRLIDKKKYFYEIIVNICKGEYDDIVSEELKTKSIYFKEALDKWREKSLYTPVDEFIWYLYSDTSYLGYVAAMPNGIQRQANLRILFQRAKQYEQTSFKGLFNFINFINKLKKSSGDLGSAKVLGENEDVVRIMSIHKSKGLEFPVVFLSGCGKQFNLMDLNNDILYHEELGIGTDCVDIERRIRYGTLAKHAIKKKFKLETLSEEMRILYVAFTRAKEKLIITGATTNLERSCKTWSRAASLGDETIPPSEVLKAKSYLDWIGMSLAKHTNGEAIRDIGGVDIKLNNKNLSTWLIKFWNKSNVFVDEIKETVDEIQNKKLLTEEIAVDIDEEIEKRLNFEYKFKESTMLPSNISVSDLKKEAYEENDGETYNLFRGETLRKPRFLQEEKGLSSAERGTIIHFMMQKVDFDKISSVNEIKMQINQMIEFELLTEEEAKVINPWKIKKFFESNLGKRLLRAHKEGKELYRELPFFTEIESTRVNKELKDEIYKDEKLRLQGVIDCFFEEDDGIVLLDYKTDYVELDKIEEILEKYKIQINLYTETIEKITGKKVKEKWLYLFYIDKDVIYE